MRPVKFDDPAVKVAFDAFPHIARRELRLARQLIFEVVAANPEIGDIVETLKWGQPSYLPKKPKIGSTLRLGVLKSKPDTAAIFFHCQTTLISNFRQRYPGDFTFEGNRALLCGHGIKPVAVQLRHCIAMALTYHLQARSSN